MDKRPNKFTELIHFFELLPENERRENLMLFAKKADKWVPDGEISIQLLNLALFLCNSNQKIANRTLIWFGLDDLLCLDK